MSDRTIRSLTHLDERASTSRVLNLLRVFRRYQKDPQRTERPFFRHPVLNKAIIVKHRLRRGERELFFNARRTATKIILPIDGKDLKLGGRYAFVDQINFDAIMAEALGDLWRQDQSDRNLLYLIDRLPSLDPFLLREQVRRNGHDPAPCYFDISESDLARMVKFVEHEIQKLVDLCYKGGPGQRGQADERRGARLVKKILSSAVDAETEPLRQALGLERADYEEGVFCWKGFLYYKWTLVEALSGVLRVADAIMKVTPRGTMEVETQAELAKLRDALNADITSALEAARESLRYYDDAYNSLLDGQPQAFRQFLLKAPAMFCALGERLGAVSHIVTYWTFRFPAGRLPVVAGDELLDIVTDFRESLAFSDAPPERFRLAS